MKSTIWMGVFVLVVAGTQLSYAEPQGGGMRGAAVGGVTKDKGDQWGYKKMMTGHRQIVATEDGGLVILSGNTLTKYDKNLKVVSEVELKSEGMGGMCAMCSKMKGHGAHQEGKGTGDAEGSEQK